MNAVCAPGYNPAGPPVPLTGRLSQSRAAPKGNVADAIPAFVCKGRIGKGGERGVKGGNEDGETRLKWRAGIYILGGSSIACVVYRGWQGSRGAHGADSRSADQTIIPRFM
jgi:hypothetical protein